MTLIFILLKGYLGKNYQKILDRQEKEINKRAKLCKKVFFRINCSIEFHYFNYLTKSYLSFYISNNMKRKDTLTRNIYLLFTSKILDCSVTCSYLSSFEVINIFLWWYLGVVV